MMKSNIILFAFHIFVSSASVILRYQLPEEKQPMYPLANLSADLLSSNLPDMALVEKMDNMQFSILSVHLVDTEYSAILQLPSDLFLIDSKTSLLKSTKSIDREQFCSESKSSPLEPFQRDHLSRFLSSQTSIAPEILSPASSTSSILLSSVTVAPSASSSSLSSASLSEQSCHIRIDMLVFSLYPIQLHWIITVILDVIDANDNEPIFKEQSIHLKLLESLASGSRFLLPGARDDDFGIYSVQKYVLLEILGHRSSPPSSSSSFLSSSSLFSLSPPLSPIPFPPPPLYNNPSFLKNETILKNRKDVSRVNINPLNIQDLNVVSTPIFSLDLISNELFLVLNKPLDRESKDSYSLLLIAYDGGRPSLSSGLLVQVQVLDVNDNAPKFDNLSYTFSVSENVPSSTTIGRIKATDKDIGLNAKLTYKLLFNSKEETDGGRTFFSINQETGDILVVSQIDHEVVSRYSLIAQAIDSGSNPLTGFTQILVEILDLNDNAPIITFNSLYPSSRVENRYLLPNALPLGSTVGYFSVSDLDSGKNCEISCSLKNNPATFFLKPIDRERYELIFSKLSNKSTTGLTINCMDSGSLSLESTKTMAFKFIDNFENYDLDIVPETFRIHSAALAKHTFSDSALFSASNVEKERNNVETRRDGTSKNRQLNMTAEALTDPAIFYRVGKSNSNAGYNAETVGEQSLSMLEVSLPWTLVIVLSLLVVVMALFIFFNHRKGRRRRSNARNGKRLRATSGRKKGHDVSFACLRRKETHGGPEGNAACPFSRENLINLNKSENFIGTSPDLISIENEQSKLHSFISFNSSTRHHSYGANTPEPEETLRNPDEPLTPAPEETLFKDRIK